jgi:hypothetical protein
MRLVTLMGVTTRRALIVAAVIMTAGAVLAAASPFGRDFIAALQKDRPDIRWDRATLVEKDFDGDGALDAALIGYSKAGVVLAVRLDGIKQPIQYLEFRTGQSQDGVCATPVKLVAYPLSCEQDGGGQLPGCVGSPHASALSIDDEACDPVNVYWNRDQHHMTWWRN